MKLIKHSLIMFTERKLLFIVVILLSLSMSSCIKEEEQKEIMYKPVTVSTSTPTTITSNSATTGGNITAPQEREVKKGVCWSINQNPEIGSSQKTSNGTGIGTFVSNITGLKPNTIYYVRAYAISSKETVYGNEVSFKTTSITIPSINTVSITSITTLSAISGGNITNDGGATVSVRGVCWSIASSPTTSNSKTSDGFGIGAFTSSITGLSSNTTYYVRAYATNSMGTAYGGQVSFKTLTVILPTLSTSSATTITTSSAISGGSITNDGGATVTSRGVCWSNSTTSPTTSYSKTIDGSGVGSFTSSITALTQGTTYYVRAYAINSAGTAYGSVVSFKTNSVSLPTISTTSISSITTSSATSGGNITSDGGGGVTSRGVCWSATTSTPTTSNSSTSSGSGTGSFLSSISGLSANTTYYLRAYATNSAGTAYGSVISFKTSAVSLPTINTSSISSITTSSANGGGNITTDGGASVTSRGVCWSSTTSSPTTSNSKTSSGSGIGSFTSSISGLSPNTTYFVRAFATNSAGTVYGSAVSFKTSAVSLPIISTTSITSITSFSATGGGNITSDGGGSVTSRGVCWSSTTSSPSTSNPTTLNGSGTGSFISSISGLSANTTYYVRAYATNSAGTAYGNVVSFKTSTVSLPTISTSSISSITTSSATGGGNITSDGGGSVTSRGVCWSSNTTYPTTVNSNTSNGSGTGSFSSSITGLSASTTYYLRAYATNSAGTAYGSMVSFSTLPSLAIGQSYQGGIIFYIDGTGLHGLICATSNQSTGIRWYNGDYIITGATTSSVGYGNSNTNTIVSLQGTGSYAARLCYDLSLNGYTDWYLPSRSELNLMYSNLKSAGLGGFSSVDYWSSTESSSSSNYAYYQSFSSGTTTTSLKSNIKYVRAVRSF